MKIKKIIAIGAVFGVTLAGAAIASPAFAEPVSNSYVAVGSDTLQDSMNALTNGSTASGSLVRIKSGSSTLGNFDAFGSPAIQTKSTGPFYGRPAGSGAGVDALRASINGTTVWAAASNATPGKTIAGQVDIARSSSGPGGNADSNGKLLYIPYGRDAVAFAYKGGTAAWANLTAAQLKSIYEGTLTSVDGVAISPKLPQKDSGTRKFFLGAIGAAANPAGVPDAASTQLAENDATVLADNQIIPFSVANWVSQANNVSGVNTLAAAPTVKLGSALSGQVAFTGTAPNLVPAAAYYANTSFGRDTYLVVERSRVDNTVTGTNGYDAVLADLVDSTKTTSLTSFASLPFQPGALKKKFGFLAPSTTTPQAAYPLG